LKGKEQLIKITLMQADLEFEYPQKLEKMKVKADVLKWLDEEEIKLKLISMAVSKMIVVKHLCRMWKSSVN
jgi:hypothetical protein